MKHGSIHFAGQEAGRKGRPHTDNPHAKDTADALIWFHAWHVATVERQTGEKILPDVPADNDELRMCRPKEDL